MFSCVALWRVRGPPWWTYTLQIHEKEWWSGYSSKITWKHWLMPRTKLCRATIRLVQRCYSHHHGPRTKPSWIRLSYENEYKTEHVQRDVFTYHKGFWAKLFTHWLYTRLPQIKIFSQPSMVDLRIIWVRRRKAFKRRFWTPYKVGKGRKNSRRRTTDL